MENEFIPFYLPLIGEDDIAEVVDTLRSGWITTGPKVKKFEEEFAEYVGCRHAVAVNSCTAALHLALDAVGVTGDDIVVTTPVTFAATAEVIRYFGAKPVFVDVDEGTLNISPALLEATLARMDADELKRVKAVIPVHMAGQPCDMDAIQDIASRHGIKVIEDAAHTLPASYKGRKVGSISDITCFSFYATKCITTGEGGMIATDDDSYAEKMRIMSLHGISKDAWKRHTKEGSWYYEVIYPGYKYNMPDTAGALGLSQLRKADAYHEIRTRYAGIYNYAFSSVPEIELPVVSDDVVHSWHLYIIKLRLDMLKVDRAQFIELLREKGVMASVHFMPLHMHQYYRETYVYVPGDFPVAAGLYDRILSLPFYTGMTEDQLRRVVEAVKEVITENRA